VAVVRQQALFGPDDDHGVEFETLGRVQREAEHLRWS
jgi:hypothetical protein